MEKVLNVILSESKYKFKDMERIFKNNIDVAEKVLKNIGINIRINENQTKSFENIVKEVADVFYKMDKDIINICKSNVNYGIKSSFNNDIIKRYIAQTIVDIRYSNNLLFVISYINSVK